MSPIGGSSGCSFHPDRPVFTVCVDCGVSLCTECTTRGDDGLARCHVCLGLDERETALMDLESSLDDLKPSDAQHTAQQGAPFQFEGADSAFESKTKQQEGVTTSSQPIPWEDRSEGGDLRAFGSTVLLAFTSPVQFMGRIRYTPGDLVTPLIFALVAGLIGQCAQLMRLLANPEPIVQAMRTVPELSHWSPSLFILCMLPLLPIALLMGLFLKSWVSHALLKMVGATQGPFETTFRIFAYAEVASILLLMPTFGILAQKFLVVFLILNGVRFAHGAGLGAGILAILPMLVVQVLGG